MSDLDTLGQRYRKALDAQRDGQGVLERARGRFAEQLHGVSTPARRPARWLVPSVAAAAVVAVVLAWPERPLGVTLRSRPDAPTDFVQTAAAEDALDFSDGTEVKVRPATQVRLLGVTAEGSQLSLERGAVHASVVHRPKARWLFSAGPYRVHVVGTQFELRWDPASTALEVAMDDGIVEVDGPGLARQRVTSHQRLEATAQPPAAALHLAPDGPPAADGPSASEPPPPQRRPRAEKAPAAGEKPRATGPSWRQLADQGDDLGAFAAAEQTGYTWLANSMPRGDVLALGEVAAKARQPARASEAWLAVRQRFPGTPGATEAALKLGQLAADVEHDDAAAIGWFARAMREAPSAATAPQALGGWLEAAVRSHQDAEAKRLAAEYLRRFRNGPAAPAAKAVLQGTPAP